MKGLAKSIANGAATLLVSPLVIAYRGGAVVMGSERVFPGWSQALSLIPGLAGAFLRRAFYRAVFPRCAADVHIGFGTVFSDPTVEIGQRFYAGTFCCLGAVTLGDDVLLGSNVSILNGGSQHGIDRLDIPIREQPGSFPRVTIGPDTWIGDRAVVMADVGPHCVVGAGSVVTRPIPAFAVAAGVPARVLRFRNESVSVSAPPMQAQPARR